MRKVSSTSLTAQSTADNYLVGRSSSKKRSADDTVGPGRCPPRIVTSCLCGTTPDQTPRRRTGLNNLRAVLIRCAMPRLFAQESRISESRVRRSEYVGSVGVRREQWPSSQPFREFPIVLEFARRNLFGPLVLREHSLHSELSGMPGDLVGEDGQIFENELQFRQRTIELR